ncbi:hypothetical protein QQF64_014919 [Cirrhinus molitorella]|uniref:Uncharacterized protein n=1 Tax=Cirrhinus molitorella TaxID=172907 RepID=A0ABR3NTH3_9TELE
MQSNGTGRVLLCLCHCGSSHGRPAAGTHKMENVGERGETQHGAVLLSELLHFNKLQSRSFTEHKGSIHVCFEGIIGEEDNHISVVSCIGAMC